MSEPKDEPTRPDALGQLDESSGPAQLDAEQTAQRDRGQWLRADLDEAHAVNLSEFRVLVWTRSARARGAPADDPNQDSVGAWEVEDCCVLCVADGVGGYAKGELASAIVLESLHDESGRLGQLRQQMPDGARAERTLVLEALEGAHARVLSEHRGAASTAIVALIRGDALRVFNVGDSGAAIVSREGGLTYRTIGHGPAHYAIAAGELEHEEILEHDEHHIVTNVVGMDPLTIDMTASLSLRKSDTLVLASDGVLDNLTWEEIAALVSTGRLDHSAAELIAALEARLDSGGGKDDDRSFLLARRR